ncbi:uncharacterized protein LOC132740760 isoform X2 [Ruditapes philippinarum]|uniref:uncharacterized protein LOC132740760 isoform X2 n=1 Tax=Ruditapes philippinarum TaxID=129788 RepID=UPI00295BD841|nr:uncharacterized protein LOC132740760 isoform X2 [Ruditapes philippinarum]
MTLGSGASFNLVQMSNDPIMKTTDSKTRMREKWSIKECEDDKGWKLKNVRRVQVKAESLDGVKIMRELHTTNFDNKFDDRYWRVSDIHIIENDKLRSQFEEYKKELIELGRSSDTVAETLAFSAETEKSCKEICKEGYKVGSKKRHVLGHTGSGVHLVRHYDILTRYLMFQQYSSPTYIVVYKTFLGKTKPIVPRLHKDDHFVSPYIGFDSHVSARHIEREMPICEALNCSYVYLYEFDQISSNPVKHPRQILPYLIIQLEKKIPSVPENPFLSVGSDATRSTWEVKGETRRGFRFMFTKSGLKGKHKVFSKTSANFGSHLKGQILEMRTKSAGSVSDAKPPLLQKINNKCGNRNDIESKTSKPPDLQKFTSRSKETNSKHVKVVLCKEVEIPSHLRTIQQLTNLKPCVKLKRLNIGCLNMYRRKVKIKSSVGNEMKNMGPDIDVFSKGSFFNVSDVTTSKQDDKIILSQLEEAPADRSSIDNRIPLEDMSSCTETSTFNICDITKGRDKTLTLAEHKSAKLSSSQNLKNQSQDLKSKTDGKKFDNMSPNERTLAVKDPRIEVTCKTLHATPKLSPSTSLTHSNNSNNKSDSLSENVHEIRSISLSNTKGLEKNSLADESFIDKQIDDEKRSVPLEESKNAVQVDNKNHAKDLIPNKTFSNSDLSEQKQNGSSNNVNICGDDINDVSVITDKSSTKQCMLESKSCSRDEKLGYISDKSVDKQLEKNENKDMRSLRKQPNDCKDKIVNRKTLSTRCSPTKTKFGEFEYKLDKNKEKQSCYLKVKNKMDSIPKKYERQAPDTKTITQEYDFIDQTLDQSQELNKQKLKNISNDGFVAKDKTVRKELINPELKSSNDHALGHDDRSKNTYYETNGSLRVDDISMANKTVESAKTSKSYSTSLVSSGKVTNLINIDKTKCDPTQIQTQHRVLEKSKSPVAANAAPDMLNINPVLVSAQTSTYSMQDSNETIANETFKDMLSSENQIRVYQESSVKNKDEHFMSEMTTFYTDNASCVRLVEQFPDNVPQTLVVNPVIRTSFSAKRTVPPVSERTHLIPSTINIDKQNSKPISNTNMAQATSNKSFKQQAKISDDKDLTLKSGDCKTYTIKNDQPIIKPKSKNENSKIHIKPKKTLTRKRKAIAATELTTVSDAHKKKRAYVNKSNKDALHEIKNTQTDSKLSKSASQEINKKEKDSNAPFVISTGEHKGLSQKKVSESSIPRGVKDTKIKSSPTNDTIENRYRNKAVCTRKEKIKNQKIKLHPSKAITEQSTSDSKSVAMPTLKHLLTGNRATASTGTDIPKEHQLKNEIVKSIEKMKTSRNAECSKAEREREIPKSVETKELASSKSSKQQKCSQISVPNLSEQTPQLGHLENQNNVKIDLHTADRVRSFLNSKAAVAMQHRKSVEQKSETDEDIDNTGFKHDTFNESNLLSTNGIQSSPVNQQFEKIEANIRISDEHENQDSKHRIAAKECTHFAKEKYKLQNTSKEPIKCSRKHVSRTTRGDSSEIHDGDSQDTIIGGVPNSPILPLTPFLVSNENTKHYENCVTNSKATVFQPINSNVIKQETLDDRDQFNAVTKDGIGNDHVRPKECQSESGSVNQVSSTLECHQELISAENIKEEPVDQELVGMHVTPVPNFESQPVKLEPFSPETSTTFFPKIRKELAKGTALLDASQCRSAIVDTLKELSFVLKFLTDSNVQNTKRKEQAAMVTTQMCNELSKERLNVTKTTEIGPMLNAGHDINLKDEPEESRHEMVSQDHLKSFSFIPEDSICRPVTEDLSYENSVSDHGFQYDYILKSSEDEYQSANESYAADSPLKETELANICQTENKNIDTLITKSTSIKEKQMTDQHEKDELPRLFDPNEESDITILEQFGIPIEQNTVQSPSNMFSSHVYFEKEPESHADHLELHGVKCAENIKIEKGKDTESAMVKTKPKQSFNFKSGILNKGLKERKNMFDLKINAPRSAAVGTVKQSDNKSDLQMKNVTINKIAGIVKQSDSKSDLETKNEKITEITCTNSKVLAKKEINESPEKENQNYQNETNDIMNEVYKTVCQKLSSLKETDIQEKDDFFSKGYFSEKVCESSSDPENAISIKDTQPKKLPGDNELINDQSMPNFVSLKVETTATPDKKDRIIPFETVLRLKKQQFWKYKRGMTNRKFIDYRECFPRMSESKRLTSPKHVNNKEAGTSESSEKASSENQNHKTTEISKHLSETENGSKQESSAEDFSRKRSCPDTDENANPKHMKYSSEKCERNDTDPSRRSRSKSSHRSSSSRQKSSMHSSVDEKRESSSFYNRGTFPHSVRPHFNQRPFSNSNFKPFYGSRPYYNSRGAYRNNHSRFNMPTNRYSNFSGKATFNKSGTGYFSWRRKYQPKRNVVDGFVLTGKGTVQSVSEYAEWTRFKERETLRDQIESAIKDYRRTFEDTADDMKGDEKVASYLTFLTEKLDKIQSKRDKIIIEEKPEDRRDKHRSAKRSSYERKKSRSPQPKRDRSDNMLGKLEKAHNFYQHEKQQHESVARFSGSLASDSDSLSYKQRRHASGIEELLKEHISKHYEHLTKQIKQEMDDLKTSRSRKEYKQSTYQKDMHRSKYDDKMKYNYDKYHGHSQERYDSKRSSKGESSRSHGDYKPTGKGRYGSQRYDEKYPYKDKYTRRHDSFRDHNDDYDSRRRDDFQYKSSYKDYGSDRYYGDKPGYKSLRNYDNRHHNRNADYRKTYDYQQNYDKYQNRFHEEKRSYPYMNKKNIDYGNDTEKPFDLRNKVLHSKTYEPKHWFRGKYSKYYNKVTVDISNNTGDNHEDDNTETTTEAKVKDEFDATKYRESTPAYRGFGNRGRGFSRGINRFNLGYRNKYLAAKFSRLRNPPTFYNHGDKDYDSSSTVKDISEAQKGGAAVETTKEKK